jgi:NAD(P)-dependent dehydrogenase (short-subunit alcohol dehydrogenase family)
MEKPFNPFSLEGKTILVTGASSGIGRQCAIDCSKMGARVVAIARNQERLDETLSVLDGDGHHSYSYDFSDTDGIAELVSTVVNDCGRIGGMVYAAGVEKTLPFKMLKSDDYSEIFKVNTISAFEMAKNVSNIKNFNKLVGGGIVFISSITATIARVGTAAYSASKGAMVSAARVLASELAARKIRVNCISPGTVLTPLMQNYLDKLSEEDYQKRIGGFPLGLGETTDISNACIYLLSDASRWITGQNIIIDGGFTMQ